MISLDQYDPRQIYGHVVEKNHKYRQELYKSQVGYLSEFVIGFLFGCLGEQNGFFRSWIDNLNIVFLVTFALASLYLLRRQYVFVWLLLGFASGYIYVSIYQRQITGNYLQTSSWVGEIEGKIESTQYVRKDKIRMVIKPLENGLAKDDLLFKVSVTYQFAREVLINPGCLIKANVRLYQSGHRLYPGSRDFFKQRLAEGIGAVGYIKKIEQIKCPSQTLPLKFIKKIRNKIKRHIEQSSSGNSKAVLIALILGEKSGISKDVIQSIRYSGLAHVLAISGLHVSIIAGLIFFLVGLLIFPLQSYISFFYIKLIVVLVTGMVCIFYSLLSGFSTPTIRATLMVLIVLAAIVLGRKAITIRGVAIAFLFILFLDPGSILEPGFQMSFSAVVALVVFAQSNIAKRLNIIGTSQRSFYFNVNGKFSWYLNKLAKIPSAIISIGLTSFVCGFATAPFVAYYFHYLSVYGLLANLICLPVITFWILPWCVLSIILLPFNLDYFGFQLAGWGVDFVIKMAEFISGLPSSTLSFGVFQPFFIFIAAISLCLLVILPSKYKLIGLIGLLVIWMPFFRMQEPELLVSRNRGTMIYHDIEGRYQIPFLKYNKFIISVWDKSIAGSNLFYRSNSKILKNNHYQCDKEDCLFQTYKGVLVLLHSIKKKMLLPKEYKDFFCQKGGVFVTWIKYKGEFDRCKGVKVIDIDYLKKHIVVGVYYKLKGKLPISIVPVNHLS